MVAKTICDVSQLGVDDQFLVCKRILTIGVKDRRYNTLFPGELDYFDEKNNTEILDEKTGYMFTQEYIPDVRDFITDSSGNVKSIDYKLIPWVQSKEAVPSP